MINKKNIAMAMAAATVASAFAPMTTAFAGIVDSNQNEQVMAVKAKVEKLINLKFTEKKDLLINNAGATDVSGKNVSNITIAGLNKVNGVEQPYTSYAAFEKAFDEAYAELEAGQTLKVQYAYAQKDAGNAYIGYSILEDGTVVDHSVEKFVDADFTTGLTAATEKKVDNSDKKAGELVKTTALDGTAKYEVKLSNTEEKFMEVKEDQNKLNFGKPVLKVVNGYYVDKNGDAIQAVTNNDIITLAAGVLQIGGTPLTNAVIVGFNLDKTAAASNKAIVSDVVTKEEGNTKITKNSSEMYNVEEGRLTQEGNKLIREIDGLWHESNEDVTYRIEKKETIKDQEYKLIAYATDTETNKETKVVELTIVADEADTRGKAYAGTVELLNRNYEGKTVTAAGEDRYETAIEISRLGWTKNSAPQVVLTSGSNDALVDGLTATPLAKNLNSDNGAPVLLTKKDEVPQNVLAELKRLGTNEIFIVGGEGSVSASVENTLKTRYGMKVTRLAGDSRYETSMAVAKEMKNHVTDINDVFVVGGNGVADALSGAAEAAKKDAPILLTPQAKLDKDVELFLTNELLTGDDVFVVGGTGSVSDVAFNKIVDLKGEVLDVERLGGLTRQDTNAAVIAEFAGKKTGSNADNIVVAKSNNAGLVDALGAGALAAKYDGMLVLATDKLTLDQEDALNDVKITDNSTDKTIMNKLQVGEGIASAVAKFIKGL